MQIRRYRFLRKCIILVAILAVLMITGSCSRHKQETPPDFDPGQAWLQDMQQEVDSTIQDNEKKEQLMSIINQFEAELNGLDETVKGHYKRLIAVDQDIQSSPDDFRQVFNAFHKQQLWHRTRFLDLRFQLKELVTAGEWDKLTYISKKDTLFLNWQRKPLQN
jgi:hypothetical protein